MAAADDPMDAFDKFADDIRNTHDELDAVDKLRAEKAADRRKPKTEGATGDAEAPEDEPPKAE